jgi:hypothetical protein
VNNLYLDQDAHPECDADPEPPETITGSFNFKDTENNNIRDLEFRFWRNINSPCQLTKVEGATGDAYSDYEINDDDVSIKEVNIECTNGKIKIFLNNALIQTLNAGQQYTLPNNNHEDDFIKHIESFGNVSDRAEEAIVIVVQKSATGSEFDITATLNWDKDTKYDRDLYGLVTCLNTDVSPPEPEQQLFDKSSWNDNPEIVIPEPYLTALNQAADRWSEFIKFNSDIE